MHILARVDVEFHLNALNAHHTSGHCIYLVMHAFTRAC